MNNEYRKSGRCWAVLIGCCLMCGIGFGIPMTTMSAFMKPMIVSLQASATQVTLYFTFVTLASIPAVIIGPRLLEKNASLTVTICGIATGVAFVLLAVAPSVEMVWFAAVVVGLFYPTASTLSAPILVANWFRKSTGLFIGIAMAFTGVGSAILVPIVAGYIESTGWQNTLLAIGVIYVIVIAITGLFFVRYEPMKMGLLPYGATAEEMMREKEEADKGKATLPGVKYKEIFRMPAFYMLAICLLLAGFASIINQQINTIAQLSGFAVGAAALVVSLMSLGNVAGKLILGQIKDKASGAVSGLFGAICMIVGMALFILGISNSSVMFMYVGAVVCGLGSCLGTMACPLYVFDTFGPREYGTILGTVTVFVTAGNALGSPAVSAFYDATGSYVGALIMLIVCTVIVVPLGFAAVKFGQRCWKNARASEPQPTKG